MVVSPFLPWVSVDADGPGRYAAGYGRWLNLLDLYSYDELLSDLIPLQPVEFEWSIALVALGLLVIGGAVYFFRGRIGGMIGLAGMIIFTFFALDLFLNTFTYDIFPPGTHTYWPETASPEMILTFSPNIGYFLGWLGSILGFARSDINRP